MTSAYDPDAIAAIRTLTLGLSEVSAIAAERLVIIDNLTREKLMMLAQLHEAAYGSKWIRPETPEHVWNKLLKTVRERRPRGATNVRDALVQHRGVTVVDQGGC